MAIHNIERCRDGCRTSLLIAGVFLVPAIFHTLPPPCHPYITIHFMEMVFSTCSTNFLICVAYKKRPSLLYHTCKYQPVPGTSLHLTELSDDVSLCAYLVEHTYLSALYKTLIIVMIKNSSNIGDTLFECVVCYYVACSLWDHHNDSST